MPDEREALEREALEREALERAIGGDIDAFQALVVRYTPIARRTAAFLGAGDETDDVVQEAFVKAYRNLRGFRRDAPFRPWLLRIVANETHNLNRRRGRRAALALRLETLGDPARAPDDPEGNAVASDRRRRLLGAVRELPEKERQAVVCRYFLQLSESEAAEVLGCPVGSIKSRTFRGLRRLRALIGEEVADA